MSSITNLEENNNDDNNNTQLPPSKKRRLDNDDDGGDAFVCVEQNEVVQQLQPQPQPQQQQLQEEKVRSFSSSNPQIKEGQEEQINHIHNNSNNNNNKDEVPTATMDTTEQKEEKEISTIDANTFLFRLPASPEEIQSITKVLKSQIDLAHGVLVQGGVEAFQRLKRKRQRYMNASSSSNGGMENYNHNHNSIAKTMEVLENMKVEDFLHSDDEDDMFGDDSNAEDDKDGSGMDSDDEAMRNKEKLALLEDAVVKGSPRRYQVALVELAKKQNTIVNLGTGQGKIYEDCA